MLKAYTCKFKVFYPVPTASIIIAEGVGHAKELLEKELTLRGLEQDIPLKEFTEIDLSVSNAHILTDGNY